jgi:oligoendopeptidase F
VFGAVADFAFERELFAARRRRELTAAELAELTLAPQRDLVGDALDQETLPRYLWAAAPHPFMPDRWFYNFPYAFGMLFGLGLHARYVAEPEAFRPAFDDLLSRTGMAEAAELAGRMGIDLRSPDFWREGLDTFRADVDRFEALVGAVTPPAPSGA